MSCNLWSKLRFSAVLSTSKLQSVGRNYRGSSRNVQTQETAPETTPEGATCLISAVIAISFMFHTARARRQHRLMSEILMPWQSQDEARERKKNANCKMTAVDQADKRRLRHLIGKRVFAGALRIRKHVRVSPTEKIGHEVCDEVAKDYAESRKTSQSLCAGMPGCFFLPESRHDGGKYKRQPFIFDHEAALI